MENKLLSILHVRVTLMAAIPVWFPDELLADVRECIVRHLANQNVWNTQVPDLILPTV